MPVPPSDAASPGSQGGPATRADDLPLLIASIAREEGITGVHTHVRQLRSYLARSGGSARMVTPHSWGGGARGPGALVLGPVFGARLVLERTYGPANVWWYRTSHELFLRSALRKRLRAAGPCVIYAQCPVSARAALSARTGPEQRVVLAVHFRISQADEWADKRQIPRGGRLYRGIRSTEREVLQAVDGLVFVSSWGRAAVREWMPEVEHLPNTVIHNFVAFPDVDEVQPEGDLVSVGNLEAVKNHRFILQVLAAARRRGHQYTLDIFGEGVEHDRLRALADELGLGEQVRLQGFRRDVQQRLSGYRACVHASYSESLPLAVIEAMAAGLPVISSRAGGLAELFVDPEEGRFWDLDDVEAAADVLVDLMEDPVELGRLASAARARFHRDYDADVVAPRLLAFVRGTSSE
jgi:glycosyltransferase involved in cell wall biosynthesis